MLTKKILIVFVTLFLISSASAIELSMGSGSVQIGSTIELDINLDSTNEIFAGQFVIEYDSSLIEFVSIKKGSYLGSTALDSNDILSQSPDGDTIRVLNGRINGFFVIRGLSETTGIAANDTFATVTFRGISEGVSDVKILSTKWGDATATEIVDPSEIVSDGTVVVTVPPVCGDGLCNGGESCSSCSADCGSCGDGSGGGSGGNGGGGGSGSDPPGDDNESLIDDFLNFFRNDSIGSPGNSTCATNWTCGEWSECVEGERFRTCTDVNNCLEDIVETDNCAGNVSLVIVGIISVASFLGLIIFTVLYFKTKRGVSLKQETVVQGAEKMRAQWK